VTYISNYKPPNEDHTDQNWRTTCYWSTIKIL